MVSFTWLVDALLHSDAHYYWYSAHKRLNSTGLTEPSSGLLAGVEAVMPTAGE